MKMINVEIDDKKHAELKSKAAQDYLPMRAVIKYAIDDYIAGKWRPRPLDRQVKTSKIN